MSDRQGTRRHFLATVAAAGAAGTVTATEPGRASPTRNPIIGFTKPFAQLSFAETADLVADVGWDGVEVAVRPGKSTHIAPERVADDLPRLVEELRKRGCELSIVTTGVVRVDAAAEKVLRTVAAVGCRRVRLGFLRYPADAPPAAWLAECRGPFREIAALCRELGIQAGYQNHSGRDFLGAPVWDLWEVIRDTDPAHLGACFDIGHATVEGGMAWPLHARLMADRLVAVFVKDFAWERTASGQTAKWCPLGQGVIDRAFFRWLRGTGFAGPISQHHEYPGLGAGPEMVAHFKRDLAVLREWLAG